MTKQHRFAPGPVAGLLALVLLLIPIGTVAADVISTNQFVVLSGDAQGEDAYVAASSGNVAGTVDGDLIIATPRLTISGLVTGDVLVLSQGPVSVSGTVEGSIRGVANTVTVTGDVGDDVAVAALEVNIDGDVGRDVIALGNSVIVTGSVGRDVLGRARNVVIKGSVVRDVDVTVDAITVGPRAEIGGDVVYQSTNTIDLDGDASVGGQVIAIPARAPFFLGLVVTVVLLLGILGFLVSGLAVLWVFRRTSEAAITAVVERPGRVLVVGLAVVIGLPLVVALLVATLVGIPLAVVLLFGVVVALIIGTVPAVTAAGALVLRGRGGAAGGFLVGGLGFALAVTLLPLFGSLLAVIVLVVGVGAWIVGAWSLRQSGWPELPAGGAGGTTR